MSSRVVQDALAMVDRRVAMMALAREAGPEALDRALACELAYAGRAFRVGEIGQWRADGALGAYRVLLACRLRLEAQDA